MSTHHDDDSLLLARIDERTKNTDINVDKLEKNFSNYVTKHEFGPVKLIAYGMAVAVLVAVLNAIIGMVVVAPVEDTVPSINEVIVP